MKLSRVLREVSSMKRAIFSPENQKVRVRAKHFISIRRYKKYQIMSKNEGGEEMGKFVVKETKSGVKFDLKAGNGEVILTSEVYSSNAACRKGIESVKTNAPAAAVENQTVEGYATEKNPKFEVYTDKAGEYRFRLKAKNGQVIAVGEGYKALAGCMNGIESIKKNAPEAPVEEQE